MNQRQAHDLTMNNSRAKDTEASRPAEQQLQTYLEEAVEAGANAIVLEYE